MVYSSAQLRLPLMEKFLRTSGKIYNACIVPQQRLLSVFIPVVGSCFKF